MGQCSIHKGCLELFFNEYRPRKAILLVTLMNVENSITVDHTDENFCSNLNWEFDSHSESFTHTWTGISSAYG